MTFLIPTQPVVIMFLLMLIGWICYKIEFIHEQTTKDLTRALLYVVSPCLIINAFKQKLTASRLQQFFLLMILVVVLFVFKILVSRILFNKKTVADRSTRTILKYSGTYTNTGFMVIPLVQALLGNNGVFFAVPYLICYNIFMWTHGIGLFQKRQGTVTDKVRQIILNPNIIAAMIGFLLFVTQFKLPLQ
nr:MULTISPECIES: AEC family transporter [Lactobacillus]